RGSRLQVRSVPMMLPESWLDRYILPIPKGTSNPTAAMFQYKPRVGPHAHPDRCRDPRATRGEGRPGPQRDCLMPHEVFLSYASNDEAVVEAVCTALESRGIGCWMAPRDVIPGAQYAEAIITAINHSRL